MYTVVVGIKIFLFLREFLRAFILHIIDSEYRLIALTSLFTRATGTAVDFLKLVVYAESNHFRLLLLRGFFFLFLIRTALLHTFYNDIVQMGIRLKLDAFILIIFVIGINIFFMSSKQSLYESRFLFLLFFVISLFHHFLRSCILLWTLFALWQMESHIMYQEKEHTSKEQLQYRQTYVQEAIQQSCQFGTNHARQGCTKCVLVTVLGICKPSNSGAQPHNPENDRPQCLAEQAVVAPQRTSRCLLRFRLMVRDDKPKTIYKKKKTEPQ